MRTRSFFELTIVSKPENTSTIQDSEPLERNREMQFREFISRYKYNHNRPKEEINSAVVFKQFKKRLKKEVLVKGSLHSGVQPPTTVVAWKTTLTPSISDELNFHIGNFSTNEKMIES